MPLTVKLPSSFTAHALYRFVSMVVSPEGSPRAETIVFDFRFLSWIDGAGLTVFCNTLQWLAARGVRCMFTNFDRPSEAIAYLDDCGFFEEYVGAKQRTNSSPRSTTLPFRPIGPSESFGWLDFEAIPWLAYVLNVDPRALASIKACMKEIFNNIADHSAETIGFVHVQQYPRVDRVHVTISDFGRGIPTTIRASYGDMSDSAAICLATQEGVSSRSTPRNRGSGLRVLVDYVSKNQGTVDIYSLTGSLKTVNQADGTIEYRETQGAGVYPGTLVNIDLPTIGFVGDEYEEVKEDFEW